MPRYQLINKTTGVKYEVEEGSVPIATAGRVPAGDYETRLLSEPADTDLVVIGPELVAAPAITGVNEVGQTITANLSFVGATGYEYRWRRDDAAISGATSATYVLVTADAGRSIDVEVRAVDQFGTYNAEGWVASSNDYIVPGVPSTAPSPFISGQVTALDSPSPAGDRGIIRVITEPNNGGNAITTLRYDVNSGADVDLIYSGPGDYVIPLTASSTNNTIRVAVGNSIGFSAFYTIPATVTPTVSSGEAPIALQIEYDRREASRVAHMEADAAVWNENNYMGFSAGEIATFTTVTATSGSQIQGLIDAVAGGKNKKVEIVCDWDGNSAVDDLYGPYRTTLTAGSTDYGYVRPDYSLYFRAASGKSPRFSGTTNLYGTSKVHFNGIAITNLNIYSNTNYPLMPMVALHGCTIGGVGNPSHRIGGGVCRVIHAENCVFPDGRIFTDTFHYLRLWNCVSFNNGSEIDIIAIRGFNELKQRDWVARIWVAGCHFFQCNPTRITGSGAHCDLTQWGTGVDAHVGHDIIWEFNVSHVNNTRPFCQGQFFGDVNPPIWLQGVWHNNLMAQNGAKGIDSKDPTDTRGISIYRNMVYRAASGTDNADYDGGSCRIGIGPATPNPDGEQKRVLENYSPGGSSEGGNSLVTNNIKMGISFGRPTGEFMGSLIKGNGDWTLLNPWGYRAYKDFDYDENDLPLSHEDAWAAQVAFSEPLVGWRGANCGPIDPNTWPTDYSVALATPSNPAVRVAATITGTAEAGQQLRVAQQTAWKDGGTSVRRWQISANGSTGWTDFSTETTILLTASEETKYLRWADTNTNLTGSTTDYSSNFGPVAAEPALGTLYTEDWSRGGTPASVGAMWAQLGSSGTLGAPLYSRTASISTADFVANAAAPQGVALRLSGSSGSYRVMWRQDIATALAGSWTALEVTVLSNHRTSANNQFGFGMPGATQGNLFGMSWQNRNDERNMRFLSDNAMPNGGSQVATSIVDFADTSTVFWSKFRWEKDAVSAGTHKRYAKCWLDGASEPVWATNASTTANIALIDKIGFVLNGSGGTDILFYTVRVI